MDTTSQIPEPTSPLQGINTNIEYQHPKASSKSRGEPLVPGVKANKRRHIPPELWVILRAAAEGRQLQLTHLSDLSGIPYDTLTDRAKRDKWETPLRKQRQINSQIAETVGGLFEDVIGYVESNSTPNELPTKSHGQAAKIYQQESESNEATVNKLIKHTVNGQYISVPAMSMVKDVDPDSEIPTVNYELIEEEVKSIDCEISEDSLVNTHNANQINDGPGSELRINLSTPAKFRPKDHDLLPKNTSGRDDKIKMLEELSQSLESELKKRARTHQMGVAEITQYSMAYMAEAVKRDPALGVLLADKIEKMDKVARRNFKLDTMDQLSGAKTVILMSDPNFLPPIPEPSLLPDTEPEPDDSIEAEFTEIEQEIEQLTNEDVS